MTYHNWIRLQTTFSTGLLPRNQDRDGQQTDYFLVDYCSSKGATVAM